MSFVGRIGNLLMRADGVLTGARFSNDSCLIVQAGHAKYQEAVLRGNVYSLTTTSSGVTLASANASTTAATAQPIVGFINPANSGVNCVILEARCGPQATGGSAANEGVYGFQIAANGASTSITGTPPTNNLRWTATGSRVIGAVNAAFTGNTITWVWAMPFVGVGPRFAAPTASINVHGIEREIVDGLIIIPPGTGIGLFTLGAGTAITVGASLIWDEVDIPG